MKIKDLKLVRFKAKNGHRETHFHIVDKKKLNPICGARPVLPFQRAEEYKNQGDAIRCDACVNTLYEFLTKDEEGDTHFTPEIKAMLTVLVGPWLTFIIAAR